MDELAAIVLHNLEVRDVEVLRNLIDRAEENRVPLLYLRTISRYCDDAHVLSRLEIWEQRKREYDLGFQKLLRKLISRNIQFLVVKHALYHRASNDVDILFRNTEEFEKSEPILRRAYAEYKLNLPQSVRPDPHVGGLRDMRGCTIIIPTEDIWSRRRKVTYLDIEVNAPSNEDEIILFHLHMLKHREIFLGDVISTMNLYSSDYDPVLLFRLARMYHLTPILSFVSHVFECLKIRNPGVKLKMPVLSQFIKFLAYKGSQGLFPLNVPKLILGLSVMHLRLKVGNAYS